MKAGGLQTELQSLELSGKVRQKVTQLTEQSSDAKTGAVVQAAAEQIDTRAEEQVRARLEEAGADPAYARDIVNRGLGIESARLREQLRQNVAVARVAQEFAAGGHGGREIGQLRELGQRIFESSEQRSRNTAYSENEYVNYVTGLSRDGRFLTQGRSAQAWQAGDGSSQPTDATGTARAMLERAFPQAGQQAQVEQTSAQGVAQNTAAPVVNGQPVYSDIALADYMAKRSAQQKFGDAQQTPVGLQETMYAQDMSAQLDAIDTDAAISEENVVASAQNDGTIETETGQTAAFVDTTVIPTYLTVIDGKVGGKVPIQEYLTIRSTSVKNPSANSIMLGKFTPTMENGVANWSKAGPDSYIVRAGTESMYFNLGSEWEKIKEKYKLTDAEMFDYFNKPVLDDAITNKKMIKFSHNPLEYPDSFLYFEWQHIKGKLGLTDEDLIDMGGMLYVRQ